MKTFFRRNNLLDFYFEMLPDVFGNKIRFAVVVSRLANLKLISGSTYPPEIMRVGCIGREEMTTSEIGTTGVLFGLLYPGGDL